MSSERRGNIEMGPCNLSCIYLLVSKYWENEKSSTCTITNETTIYQETKKNKKINPSML